jgi:elongation factor 1-alpha
MDVVNYNQESFNNIKKEVLANLKKIGYNDTKINVVGFSEYKGDNLILKSNKMPWYNGDTLLEALNKIVLH